MKFVLLSEEAILPTQAHIDDAGLDLTAIKITSELTESGLLVYSYHTGLGIDLSVDKAALLLPRSSIYKTNLILTNSVGLIDSGYKGELIFKFRTLNDRPPTYKVGDRIGQIIIINKEKIPTGGVTSPKIRGQNGFGSSGL